MSYRTPTRRPARPNPNAPIAKPLTFAELRALPKQPNGMRRVVVTIALAVVIEGVTNYRDMARRLLPLVCTTASEREEARLVIHNWHLVGYRARQLSSADRLYIAVEVYLDEGDEKTGGLTAASDAGQ